MLMFLFTELSIIIASITGILFINRLSRPLLLVLSQVIVALVVESYGRYLSSQSISNNWLYNVYCLPLYFLLFASLYSVLKSKFFKLYTIFSTFFFCIIWMWCVLFSGINTLAITAILCGNILLAAGSLFIIAQFMCKYPIIRTTLN